MAQNQINITLNVNNIIALQQSQKSSMADLLLNSKSQSCNSDYSKKKSYIQYVQEDGLKSFEKVSSQPTTEVIKSEAVATSEPDVQAEHSYEERTEIEFSNHNIQQILGYFMIAMGAIFFCLIIFCGIFLKLMDDTTNHPLLEPLQKDDYYCSLIPLTIPVTVIFIYANWVTMKFFRHA